MSIIIDLTTDIQFRHQGELYSISEFQMGFNKELLIKALPVENFPFNEELIKT